MNFQVMDFEDMKYKLVPGEKVKIIKSEEFEKGIRPCMVEFLKEYTHHLEFKVYFGNKGKSSQCLRSRICSVSKVSLWYADVIIKKVSDGSYVGIYPEYMDKQGKLDLPKNCD